MTTQRIDVHHHFLPPAFLAELSRQGAKWTGGPVIPDWNASIAREVMARRGIGTAMASVVPGVYWGDVRAASYWARHVNEFGARIVQDDPEHFGYFAQVPLPDVQAALREVEYAFDVLKADGITLMSSYGNQYPGDPAFDELFQELERRKAVVFMHPNTVPPGASVPQLSIPWGIAEFLFDTTRAVSNLLYSGTLDRHPSVRYILSHAGGTIPYIALRMQLSEQLPGGLGARIPKGTRHYLSKLYYDTTLSTSEQVFAALKQFVPTSQVLFGSDYPMVAESVAKTEIEMIEASKVLDADTRRAIYRDNALALFPRLVASTPSATRLAG
jgi:predicted TIM-barrel fold metal-dependent hydrolase